MTSRFGAAEICSICMTPLEVVDHRCDCPACHAKYHAECWDDNHGCAVYGCPMVPTTEGLKALEIPPAFWGREDKECPECGEKILALAVRCRHCGSAIEARPEGREAYQARVTRRGRAPFFRRTTKVLLVGAMIPVVALVVAIVGTFFFRSNRETLRSMPGSSEGLLRIAIGLAATQSAITALALIAFVVKGAILR